MERTTLYPVLSFVKQVSVIDGNGKTAKLSLQCNSRQHKLTEGLPPATEGVSLSWIPDTPNAAIRRNHLENDV